MPETNLSGLLVKNERPTPYSDDDAIARSLRGNRYAEQGMLSMLPTRQALADEGSFFTAKNVTPGTGLQYALITAYSATAAGIFAAFNGNSVASKRRAFLDYYKLLMSGTAPTATTVLHCAVVLDDDSMTPTAGSPVTLTGVNVNGDSDITPGLVVQHATGAAAITTPAAGSARRIVARGSIPTSLGITGDEYLFTFGHDVVPGGAGMPAAVRATAATRLVENLPPVIIAPQQWCIFILWWLTAATTAPTFEVELGWSER